MRTVALLTRAHLRGRRRCTPQLPRSLLAGNFDINTVTASNFTHGEPLVDRSKVHAYDFPGHGGIFYRGFTAASGPDRNWMTYDPKAFSEYYKYRPFLVAYRATILISEVVFLSIGQVVEKDVHKRAERMGQSLIRLGAFYIKLGQALSTRPDILPSAYCQELAKLQDNVPAYPTPVALQFLESELGLPASELYAHITPQPIAAASLGQVYKARLHSGEMVAVKVQRPGVTDLLALDAYLLGILGGPLQRFAGARSDLIAMINEMVERMFEEVDYVREGRYAERFQKLYGATKEDISSPDVWHGRKRVSLKVSESGGDGVVKVPKVYWDFTSRGVLTMEWVDGLKLTDAESLKTANLDTQSLVDQGVFCSLRQLLEEGFFHADPHPGNLVVTEDGVLTYFDFGMMSEMRKEYRIGLIRTIVHFVNRDSLGLANDFIDLGFIPKDYESTEIAEALEKTFDLEGRKSHLDFQGIMAQLSEVMYQFKFRLPPEFAMVIRALGSLEGTATILDPGFKVVASAYPFIVGRLLADPDPAMREVLRELLIRSNGSIRWQRLERLIFAIVDQSSSPGKNGNGNRDRAWQEGDGLGQSTAPGIKGTFDTRAVASATMDVMNHILSDKGVQIRTLLVRDMTQIFDRFLQQSMDIDKLFENSSIPPVGQDLQGDQAGPSNPNESIPAQETTPEQAQQLLGWSQYTTASYWGRMAGRRVLGEDLWQRIEYEKGAQYGAHRADMKVFVEMSPEKGGTDGGQASGSEKGNDAYSSVHSNVDDFMNRVQVGLQAFANVVNSSPEIWIPLITRLACNSEARSLVANITLSLREVYCSRTSKASFILMSKSLHKGDTGAKSEVS